jgi:hypothetical protein
VLPRASKSAGFPKAFGRRYSAFFLGDRLGFAAGGSAAG